MSKLETLLTVALSTIKRTTFSNTNQKLAVLGVAVLKYSGLYKNFMYVCLEVFGRAYMEPIGPSLVYMKGRLLSKEGMERYKSNEINVVTE